MKAGGQAVTLFLIEDDDVDAMTIERALLKRRLANPLVRAKDGLQALDMLRSGAVKKPYITLLDLKMPRMGGLEFLSEIRSDKALKESVVFVLTTSDAPEDIKASYEKNVAGFILKNSTAEEFLTIVDMLKGYWKIVCLPTGP